METRSPEYNAYARDALLSALKTLCLTKLSSSYFIFA